MFEAIVAAFVTLTHAQDDASCEARLRARVIEVLREERIPPATLDQTSVAEVTVRPGLQRRPAVPAALALLPGAPPRVFSTLGKELREIEPDSAARLRVVLKSYALLESRDGAWAWLVPPPAERDPLLTTFFAVNADSVRSLIEDGFERPEDLLGARVYQSGQTWMLRLPRLARPDDASSDEELERFGELLFFEEDSLVPQTADVRFRRRPNNIELARFGSEGHLVYKTNRRDGRGVKFGVVATAPLVRRTGLGQMDDPALAKLLSEYPAMIEDLVLKDEPVTASEFERLRWTPLGLEGERRYAVLWLPPAAAAPGSREAEEWHRVVSVYDGRGRSETKDFFEKSLARRTPDGRWVRLNFDGRRWHFRFYQPNDAIEVLKSRLEVRSGDEFFRRFASRPRP